MSATLGAALKKIAVALLTDRRNWEKIAVALFAVLLLFLLPILSVEAIFQADMDWDSPELVFTVLEELDVGSLGFLENSNNILTQLQTALKEAGFGFDEFRKAQALYWLALSPYAEEAGFIEKLVGCFAPDQTNEELVANVNAAFGTDIDPEEFEKFLATTASDMVAIAQSQVGQTGGQPYWSWYGFSSRVEWCAIFVSWCANQCGYIDAGIVPKFAGCGVGVQSHCTCTNSPVAVLMFKHWNGFGLHIVADRAVTLSGTSLGFGGRLRLSPIAVGMGGHIQPFAAGAFLPVLGIVIFPCFIMDAVFMNRNRLFLRIFADGAGTFSGTCFGCGRLLCYRPITESMVAHSVFSPQRHSFQCWVSSFCQSP